MKKKFNIFEVYGQVHNEKIESPKVKQYYSPISKSKHRQAKIVDGKFSLMESLNESVKSISNNTKRKFLEIVSTFESFRKKLERQETVTDTVKTICAISEAARELTINEMDESFDAVTVNRNMKELKRLEREMEKCAVESQRMDQRMSSIYEEMGTILNRYYEIKDIDDETVKRRLGEF